MKPNLCTPTHGGLSNGTKRHKKLHYLGDVIATWKTKQNKLTTFMDGWVGMRE
jgi:hypothetical protein